MQAALVKIGSWYSSLLGCPANDITSSVCGDSTNALLCAVVLAAAAFSFFLAIPATAMLARIKSYQPISTAMGKRAETQGKSCNCHAC
jgi:hypothetical protein